MKETLDDILREASKIKNLKPRRRKDIERRISKASPGTKVLWMDNKPTVFGTFFFPVCRTQYDMTKKERDAIEKQYGCKIKMDGRER